MKVGKKVGLKNVLTQNVKEHVLKLPRIGLKLQKTALMGL